MSGETPSNPGGSEADKTNPLVSELEAIAAGKLRAQTSEQKETNRFFDPEAPDVPAEVIGVPTRPLLDLGNALGSLVMMRGVGSNYQTHRAGYHAKYSMEPGLSLFPLIARVQAGEQIKPEEVRPYRKSIKQLSTTLSNVDKLAAASAAIGIGIPARRAINRRIENEFPERVKPLLEQAKQNLPKTEPYVEFLSQFERPRHQFLNEVATLAYSVRYYAREQAKRYDDNSVTAEDAAMGIQITIESITGHPEWSQEHIPMLKNLVIDRVPARTPMPSAEMLAIAAPEIIKALEVTLPEEQRDPMFLRSVKNHPHSRRGLAETFKGEQLRQIDRIANLLLPSIRNLLPETGQEIKDTYDKAKSFLGA